MSKVIGIHGDDAHELPEPVHERSMKASYEASGDFLLDLPVEIHRRHLIARQ
jgi:hypothetical protein